jgi:hypothetical protein
MRATPDASSDGGAPHRRRPRMIPSGMLAVIVLPAILAAVVSGAWLVHLGKSSVGSARSATAPDATNGVVTFAASPSDSATRDDAVQGTPPSEAMKAAEDFASAWALPGSSQQRRTALEPVASAYLVRTLTHVQAPLPDGRQENPRLVSGSVTAARYRIGFSSGEAITVSVDLVGSRWMATQVDPATSAETFSTSSASTSAPSTADSTPSEP